jgi:hypothetical protein
MGNLTMVQDVALATFASIGMSIFDGRGEDSLLSISLPLFMLEDAIDSMKQIEKIGQSAHDAERKSFINTIIMAIFMIVPFIGEAAAIIVPALAMVARLITVAVAGADVGKSIYDVVKDPSSAPFLVLSILANAYGIKGAVRVSTDDIFKQASQARKLLRGEQLSLFTDSFRRKDGLVQSIVKSCARK